MATPKKHLSELLLESTLHDPMDRVRSRIGFSPDIQAVQAILFNPKSSRQAKIAAYREWLETNQPCVFGRIAAKNKNILARIYLPNQLGKGDNGPMPEDQFQLTPPPDKMPRKKTQKPKGARRTKKDKEKRAKIYTELGFAFGLAWGGYSVVPISLIFGEILFVAAAGCVLAAIIEYFEPGAWKVSMCSLLLVVTCAVLVWGYYKWVTTTKADILHNLNIVIATPDASVAVSNRSSEVISHHVITCGINSLRDASEGHIHDVATRVLRDSEEALAPGGDTRTESCLRIPEGGGFIKFNEPIKCADITVFVDYSLNTTPIVKGKKELRFVWGKFGEKSWVGQPVDRKKSDCD